MFTKRLHIVTEPVERRYGGGGGYKTLSCNVIVEGSGNKVQTWYVNGNHCEAEKVKGLKIGQLVCVTALGLGVKDNIRATKGSKVFVKSATFEIPEGVVGRFLSPPKQSIAEIKTSGQKRRVSLEGEITEVGGLVSETHYKRRRLLLEDSAGQTISLKMWNQEAEKNYVEHSMLSIVGAEVDGYNPREIQVQTTPESSIQIHERDAKKEVLLIMAVNDDEVMCKTEGGEEKEMKNKMGDNIVSTMDGKYHPFRVLGEVIMSLDIAKEKTKVKGKC